MTIVDLARGAADWLAATAGPAGDASLYTGSAGVALALLEAHRDLGDDRYAQAAAREARSVAEAVDTAEDFSLYFGLAGMAWALHMVGERTADPALVAVARRAYGRVRANFDGEGWGIFRDLLGGNPGVGLAALAVGDPELALLAVRPLVELAESTPYGVTWPHRLDGVRSRLHHISHGALGIALALATIGRATDRADLLDLARAGAAEVVSRNEAGPGGFLVPHSDPQYRPEINQRFSYGWCHGPAGDAQVFRGLAVALDDPAWTALADRCWHTVTTSGLPTRLRPGFWDNSGRCCGTAGVLALAADRYAEGDPDLSFAETLVADLTARATVDAAGARWSNHEHRADPSDLPPEPGWAMGNAGILRELLRYARLTTPGAHRGYHVAWPDHPPVTT